MNFGFMPKQSAGLFFMIQKLPDLQFKQAGSFNIFTSRCSQKYRNRACCSCWRAPR